MNILLGFVYGLFAILLVQQVGRCIRRERYGLAVLGLVALLLHLISLLLVSYSAHASTLRMEVSIVLDDVDRAAADEALRDAGSIFRDQLGIELAPVYYESAHVSDHTKASALLIALQSYRLDRPSHRSSDATVMFTSRTLSQSYDGYASIGPACSSGAAAVVEIHADGLDGHVTAHELLHTIGVMHDRELGWLMAESFVRSGREWVSNVASPDTIATVKAAPLDCMLPPEPRAAAPSNAGAPSGGGGTFDPVSIVLLIALAAVALIQQYRLRAVEVENKALDHEIRQSIKELHDCVPPDFCLRDISRIGHLESVYGHIVEVRFTTLAGLIEFEHWLRYQAQRARRDAQGNPYFTRRTD